MLTLRPVRAAIIGRRRDAALCAAALTVGATVIGLMGGCSGGGESYGAEIVFARLPTAPERPTDSSAGDEIFSAKGDEDGAAPEAPMRTTTRESARNGLEVAVLAGSPAVRPEGPTLGASDAAGAEALAKAATAEAAAAPSPAAEAPARANGTSRALLVDSMVGHINGHPVYASEFFAEKEAHYRGEARRLPPAEWLAFVRQDIAQALRVQIRDELILAEFEASLKPEEKAGLLYFVSNLREELISQARGSRERAERRAEEEGKTLDEVVASQRDRALIYEQLKREIRSKVFVSWQEIQVEFERNRERYLQPGAAKLRMIWIPAGDSLRADRVATQLAAGEPFADVASRESDFNPKEGGLQPVSLDGPTYAESRILAVPELNEHAKDLEVGETAGPFDYSGRLIWMRLEEVFIDTRSLFDFQDIIRRELVARREDSEMDRYLRQLMERSSMTEIEEMENRLFEIAAHRYLLSGRKP